MLNTKLEAIADAIRYKRNSTNNYYLNEMPNEINNIGSGVNIQPYKVVNYSSSGTYEVLPDTGYEALNSVIVGVQAGGQDLSNLITWDTTSRTGWIGSNARNLTGAFYGKYFSDEANALVLPNAPVNLTNAFSQAFNTKLEIPNGTTFVNLYHAFASGSYFNTQTLQNVLYTLSNSDGVNCEWAFRQATSKMLGVVDIGSCLDKAVSLQYAFYRPGSNIIFSNVNINLKYINVITGMVFDQCSFSPKSIAYIQGSVSGGPIFSQCNNLNYIDAKLHENYTMGVANSCNMLLGIHIEHGWGWMNNSHHSVSVQATMCPNLRSVDYKLHNRTSSQNYCSVPTYYQSFQNDNNLSDVWLDLSELDEFIPAGSTTSAHLCLNLTQTFARSNNIERVFINYPTYNNFFNILFANTFLTLTTATKHDIVLGGRNLYNRVLLYNAAVFSGVMTFTEETVDDNIVFNFYNENNMVNYTKSVHVVRCAYNTAKNVYVYCTE